MADAQVVKVVTIIGSSPESFAKAADEAVKKASETIRNMTGVDVVSMSAKVTQGGDVEGHQGPRPAGISEYRTTLNIAFVVDR